LRQCRDCQSGRQFAVTSPRRIAQKLRERHFPERQRLARDLRAPPYATQKSASVAPVAPALGGRRTPPGWPTSATDPALSGSRFKAPRYPKRRAAAVAMLGGPGERHRRRNVVLPSRRARASRPGPGNWRAPPAAVESAHPIVRPGYPQAQLWRSATTILALAGRGFFWIESVLSQTSASTSGSLPATSGLHRMDAQRPFRL
jgi:hypothetical protein